MKGQNRIRQLHLDRSLTLLLQVPDNGVPGLVRQSCRQSCTDFERAVQIELRRRIIPVGNVCPESPRKLPRRVAFGRMLKLPNWLAHAMCHRGYFLTVRFLTATQAPQARQPPSRREGIRDSPARKICQLVSCTSTERLHCPRSAAVR